MKAIVYHGHEDFRLEDVPDAKLRDETDVLLRVERTAICGSDLHLWHGPTLPVAGFALGHEFLGVVEDAGSAVRTVKRGDRVLVSCTTGCGTCGFCRRGLYSGCPVATAGGTAQNVFGFSPGLPGGQAEAVRVPFADANTVAIPPHLDAEQVLFLTDILPTAYMGTEFAEVGPGDTVVVFGCGPVGSLAQRCAQLRGAARVIAVDPDRGRLNRARQRGCDAVDPGGTDLAQHVRDCTGGSGADAVIEAVGRPELIQQSLGLVRHGGRVAVIGVVMTPVDLPWSLVFGRNLTLRSGLVNPQTYIPSLLPAIEAGRLDPAEIISHRLDLADGVRGYEIFAGHEDDVLKVVLTP